MFAVPIAHTQLKVLPTYALDEPYSQTLAVLQTAAEQEKKVSGVNKRAPSLAFSRQQFVM